MTFVKYNVTCKKIQDQWKKHALNTLLIETYKTLTLINQNSLAFLTFY